MIAIQGGMGKCEMLLWKMYKRGRENYTKHLFQKVLTNSGKCGIMG